MKSPRELPGGQLVRGADFNALLAYVKRHIVVSVGPGLGMKDSGAGRLLCLVRNPLDRIHQQTSGTDPGGGGAAGFFAKITAVTAENATQWRYTAQRVTKANSGYNTGSWVMDGTPVTCYNSIEYMNSAVGVQGNGVDITGTDFPAGFELQPCPVGNIVWLHKVGGLDDYELWFSYESGVDGTCP